MPPSRPHSTEELIEILRRVADSQLQLSAASNRLANAHERLLPAFEQIRHDLYDIKTDREMDTAKLDLAIGRVGTDLALILDNVRHAQTDVRELQRDVTGAFKMEQPSQVERVIGAFEKLKTPTKILIAVIFLVAALSGWLTHWIGG